MHAEALAFVQAATRGRRFSRVVDVGGRDINGSPRPYVDAGEYVSVDLVDGPGVDHVADIITWEPESEAALVICCEVLEHAPEPERVVAACLRLLAPGGTLILTCAGPGRAPHSAADGGVLRQGEHYANVGPDELRDWLPGAHVEHHPARGDSYAIAVKD